MRGRGSGGGRGGDGSRGGRAGGPGGRGRSDGRPREAAVEGKRRSLANLGGPARFTGDASWREPLERAMALPEAFDERALTHGFHAWPARLHPHTARSLIALAPPGAIGDPFMGGGTVPLEARLAGRMGVGTDLNPVGLEVAWVRTRRLDARAIGELHDAMRLTLKLAQGLADEGRVPPAYRDKVGYALDPQAMKEVWALATIIGDRLAAPGQGGVFSAYRVLRAALSSILVKVSRLVSDTVAKVDRERPGFTPRGRVFHWFKRRVFELADQLGALAKALPAETPEPALALADARTPPRLPPLAAVVSSPPYPGIYDYVEHHKLRLLALGLPLGPMLDHEIGSRRESERLGLDQGLTRYERDLGQVLGVWGGALTGGGFVAFVIGDGQVGKKVTPVLPLLERAASSAGLVVKAVVSQPRPVFAGTRRVEQGKDEHLVLLTRGVVASK